MKVLFIGSDPHLLDSASSAYARIRSYADAIGEITVLMKHKGEPVSLSEGPLTIECISAHKVAGFKTLTSRAREIIAQRDVDVVSAQDPFEHGLVALRATRGTRAKLHIQVHTDFLSPWFTRSGIFRSPQVMMPAKNALRRRIASYVLPRAQGIRAVSQRIADSLTRFYGSTIVTPTVLPIVPQEIPPPKVPLPCELYPYTLVTVGRLEPEKRVDDILDALARLRAAYPQVGLVIIGDGRERSRLEAKAKELELSSRVTFLGARPDAWGLMQSAHAYIQASAYEGYGIALVEAALARLPIVSSDVGVIGEVLRGFDDVLVSPPGDPTNLAYHIISLLEDPASREVRVRNAEQRAREHVATYQNLPERIASDLAQVVSV